MSVFFYFILFIVVAFYGAVALCLWRNRQDRKEMTALSDAEYKAILDSVMMSVFPSLSSSTPVTPTPVFPSLSFIPSSSSSASSTILIPIPSTPTITLHPSFTIYSAEQGEPTFHIPEMDECPEPAIRQGACGGLRGAFMKGWYQDRAQRGGHGHIVVLLATDDEEAVHHTFWGLYPYRDINRWIGMGYEVEVSNAYCQKPSSHQAKMRLKVVDMGMTPNSWTSTGMADDILKREQEEAMWDAKVGQNAYIFDWDGKVTAPASTTAQLRYAFRFPPTQEDMDMWPDMVVPLPPRKDIWWMIEQDRLALDENRELCGCGKALSRHANMCYDCYCSQYSVLWADTVWSSKGYDIPSDDEHPDCHDVCHECLMAVALECRYCGAHACDCEKVDVNSLIF